MQLRVWQDARELYLLTWSVVKHFPYELKRIVSQQTKQQNNDWDNSFIVKESNEIYITRADDPDIL